MANKITNFNEFERFMYEKPLLYSFSHENFIRRVEVLRLTELGYWEVKLTPIQTKGSVVQELRNDFFNKEVIVEFESFDDAIYLLGHILSNYTEFFENLENENNKNTSAIS